MAYYTGSGVLDINELLEIIHDRAEDNGFTSLKDVTVRDDGVSGYYIYLQNSIGCGIVFKTEDDVDAWNATSPRPRMYIYLKDDLTASTPLGEVTRKSTEVVTNGLWGPFTSYFIFVTSQYLQVVVETKSKEYAHFGYAMHENKWSYTGGECIWGTGYYYGSHYNNTYSSRLNPDSTYHSWPFASNHYSVVTTSNTACRCNLEGGSPRYFPMIPGNLGATRNEYMAPTILTNAALGNIAYEYNPSTLNGIASLFPLTTVVTLSDKHRMIGQIPNMRLINITSHEPEEVISYGEDDWMVFPLKKKQLSIIPTTPSDTSSGVYGFAYRK